MSRFFKWLLYAPAWQFRLVFIALYFVVMSGGVLFTRWLMGVLS